LLETKGRLTFLQLVVALAAVAVILGSVRAASDIISQFLMAFVIAVAVMPLQMWLTKKGLPPIVAFILTALAVIGGLGLLIVILVASLNEFATTLPEYESQMAETQSQIQDALNSFGITQESLDSTAATSDASGVLAWLAGVASWLLGAFTNLGFMLAIAAFMLLETFNFPKKIAAVASPEGRRLLGKFVTDIRTYMIVTTKVNLMVGVVDTVLLMVMGVPFPLLWGVLAFLFGFIPSIGFLLSLVGPALMAWLALGPTEAIIVIVAFIVINGGIQNIVMPRQMGEGTGLSPAVVFGSLVFWGWVLGPVGAILSVPMTMITKLALDSADSTRGIAYLMTTGKHPFEKDGAASAAAAGE
jgi:predicted PurR-regulated permease PerM